MSELLIQLVDKQSLSEHAFQEQLLDKIMAIEVQAYPIPWSKQQFLDCHKAGYKLYTATNSNGTMIGYWVVQQVVDELHILNICVLPEQQGNGYGHYMLEQLFSVGQLTGCNRVLLEVRRDNKAARRLYQKVGFHTIGTRKGYYPGTEGERVDAIVMEYLFA